MPASEIAKDVNILVAIRWSQDAWREVSNTTIKNCFDKCGIVKSNGDIIAVEDEDLEFETLVQVRYLCFRLLEFRR